MSDEVERGPVAADENTPLLSRRQLDESDFEAALTKTKHLEREDFPDGGLKAWLVVFGSWCAMLAAFGQVTSMGVMHAWLSNHQLEDHSFAETGWIFSTFLFLLYFGSLQVGPIFDAYGLKYTLVPGCVGLTASIFLLPLCEQFWQFMLVWGVLGGISECLIFTPTTVVIGHWFFERRALATSIALTAGGVGGALFPFILLNLEGKFGFDSAVRVIGAICITLFTISLLLVRTRLPPNTSAGAAIDPLALLEPLYATTSLAVLLLEMALFIPVTYITSYALAQGYDSAYAFSLVIFLNIGSVFGRAVSGWFADHYGRFRAMVVTSFLCTALTPLWYLSGNDRTLITVYAVAFGAASGSVISITPVCIAQICLTEDYGKRYGTTYFIVSFGTLVAVPLAGAILDTGKDGVPNFPGLIWFSGGLFAAGMASFVVAMGMATKWNFTTKF